MEDMELTKDYEPGWWKGISYGDAKEFIKTNIQQMSRSFIAIGYYLKYIRDSKGYEEDGYRDIWEFAGNQYGISRSTASRWMAMNDKFSAGGNSPIVAEQYKGFGKSQLQEMLYLTDEKVAKVSEDMTVKEIRKARESEKAEPEEPQEKSDPAKCITCKSGTGYCGAAAYCDEPASCCAACDKLCNSRCGWLDEPQADTLTERPETSIDELDVPIHTYTILKRAGIDTVSQLKEMTRDQLAAVRGIGKRDVENIENALKDCSELNEGDEILCDTCANASALTGNSDYCANCGPDGRNYVEMEECAMSHIGTSENCQESEPEEDKTTEIQERAEECCEAVTVKIDPKDLLREKRGELIEWMKAFEGEGGYPEFIEKQKVIVEALTDFVAKLKRVQTEMELQPELPVFKNNDQRKEWLRSYQSWGLWYEDVHIGARYYKYEFENGAVLIAEEYRMPATEYCSGYTSSYLHLIGGPEPPKAKNGARRWTTHEIYSRYPNSETELVEFLKEIQK